MRRPHRVLLCDVWGDYACFRRFYTTASPLTYAVPPPPALAGLLGAIVGLGRDEAPVAFAPDRCFLAVGLRAPIRTLRLGLNWIDTKESPALRLGLFTHHSPILLEVLVRPRYRLYVAPADPDLYTTLRHRLRTHTTVYPPALGKNEFLADFAFIDEVEATPLPPGPAAVASVLPADRVLWPPAGRGVIDEPGKRYEKQRLPLRLAPDRQPQAWTDILLETTGRPILADVTGAVQTGGEIVVPVLQTLHGRLETPDAP